MTPPEPRWLACRRRNPEARLRVYCFPHAGGSAGEFLRWADLVPPEVELWCVQLPGRGSRIREQALTSVDELAAALAAQASFDAPYLFFGHSLGAYTAFETARALRRADKSGLVALIVSANRPPDRHVSPLSAAQVRGPELLSLVEGLYGPLPAEFTRAPDLAALYADAMRADMTMVADYRDSGEPPLSCPITAFGGQADRIGPEELADWSRHSTAHCDSRLLPGGHFFFRDDPAAFFDALRTTLLGYLGAGRTSTAAPSQPRHPLSKPGGAGTMSTDPLATIDLRSETVTKPSTAMRAAMHEAEVGDDTLGEDPTVSLLERTFADAFGFGAALFLPSGVMANQLGLRLLAGAGQEVIADANSHFLLHEDAGVAWHGGIQTRTLLSADGLIDPLLLAELIRPVAQYGYGTRAVAVENTHNRRGGTVYPIEHLQRIRATADEHGIGVHCDGARLWNAHVATGTPLSEYGACFDTLAVCVSKGLGAPAGSVLMFAADRLAEARVMRHRMGGSMRQVGSLAAAGLYAFEHNLARLAEDHENARLITAVLREHGFSPVEPQTNIVLLDVPDAAAAIAECAARGLRVTELGPRTVRLVTHLDVSRAQCEQGARILAEAARKLVELAEPAR